LARHPYLWLIEAYARMLGAVQRWGSVTDFKKARLLSFFPSFSGMPSD